MRSVLAITLLAGAALPAQADQFNMLEVDERPSLHDFDRDPDTVLMMPTEDGFKRVQPGAEGELPDDAWVVPMTNPVVRVPALPDTQPVDTPPPGLDPDTEVQ